MMFDYAECNSALAMVVEPSEAITQTWHVINKTPQQWSLNYNVCDVTQSGVLVDKDEDAFVSP